mmetsp:Transcript_54367/g.80649  ORF Transcript_54367/g.80649 Transcript_54367/m.80649 type:complete len:536 (+) Transcript_54367:114-1721(+)|eukprot:CAMPEP_0195535000 /NCGR_PEP_ID=MMETSP0794_2-20130614/43463_1 /TAXON_ID=515487 /ORGANISM="Stephanopyxis turris, Strain CCMP 815" /LENGTH=535 /DNA_ID=CAMNT_0040668011 /DNA_START=106 /DNA_END=1713 /DNA_ORIENTATION=+
MVLPRQPSRQPSTIQRPKRRSKLVPVLILTGFFGYALLEMKKDKGFLRSFFKAANDDAAVKASKETGKNKIHFSTVTQKDGNEKIFGNEFLEDDMIKQMESKGSVGIDPDNDVNDDDKEVEVVARNEEEEEEKEVADDEEETEEREDNESENEDDQNDKSEDDEEEESEDDESEDNEDGDDKVEESEEEESEDGDDEEEEEESEEGDDEEEEEESEDDEEEEDEEDEDEENDYGESEKSESADDEEEDTNQSPKPPNESKIKEISIIGERNSGTRWTVTHVGLCFNHTIRVREKLVRHKHWFQHDVPNERERVPTLVLAQFRDPHYWVEAMRNVPHHSPQHLHLDWETFVTTPWTMKRLANDTGILKKAPKNEFGQPDTKKIKCQEWFNYDQINSCMVRPYPDGTFTKKPPYSGHQPQYEMRDDGSGRPYSSIVDLRAAKIRNFLKIESWDWIEDFTVVRYEDLLARGTEWMIEHIEEVTGIPRKEGCKTYPAQDRKKRALKKSFIKWMTDHVDWEAEKLIGYVPRGSEEKAVKE